MRRLILVLTGTTLALAATCLVLLQQVRLERDRAQAETALRYRWEARFTDLQGSRSAPQPSISQAAASVPPVHESPAFDRNPKAAPSAAHSADERFLILLATPAGHAQLIAEETLQRRRHDFDLATQLHLTAEEEEQLLSVEAEQTLKSRARYARCRLDLSCNIHSLPFNLEQQQQPVRDLLGAQRFAAYERYQGTTGVRLTVRELRTRLSSANALSDEQAETLVDSMHDESEKAAAEAQAMGHQSSFGIGSAFAYYDEGASEAEIMSAVQESARRVRERVGALLTVEQMRIFSKIQEEQLSQARASLRNRE